MVRDFSATNIFVTGAARFRDLLYLSMRDRDLVEKEIEHSRFLAFDQGEWAHIGDVNWTTAAMCVVKVPSEKMLATSEDGEALAYVGGVTTSERIGPGVSVLRDLASIGGRAYACGMKRQVFKRDGEGTWTAMHAPAPKRKENAGFEAINGFDESEVYAVGWNGEIWLWDGGGWSSIESGTNMILTAIDCASDGQVYICGQNGTLITGRQDTWVLIDLEDISNDFWDIIWFKDNLYIATMQTLFTYAGGIFQPVSFGQDAPATCYHLTTAEGVLWSIGANDVFSFDGITWTRID